MNEITTEVRLQTLGAEIRLIHERAVKTALEACIQIGQRLTEAKELVGHGNWTEWLKENVSYSTRQANNYMSLYEGYGSGQISLTGDALPESFKALEPTKALKLLSIPAEDREEFAEQVGADSISTRQLQEEIKQYKQRMEDADYKMECLEHEVREANEEAYQRELQCRESDELLKAAQAEAQNLQTRIDELENRPAEVIEKEPSAEEMEALRDEGRKEGAEAEALRWKAKVAAAEANAQEARQALEENSQAISDLQEKAAHADDLERQLEAERKKSKVSDNNLTQLQVYAQSAQEDFNRAVGCAMKASAEQQEKLKAYLKAVVENMGKAIDRI